MSDEPEIIYESRYLAVKEDGSIAISDGVDLCNIIEPEVAEEVKSVLDKVLPERERGGRVRKPRMMWYSLCGPHKRLDLITEG